MHLTNLALTNFRNYAHLELALAPGLTLLQGNNACGKTNLLEALFYLATAHSPHAGAERELIRWGASTEPIPFARAETEVVKTNGRTQLEIVLVQAGEGSERFRSGAPNGRVTKRIKVNGVPKRTLDLLGELNVVLFLPEDLDLVFGSPGDRRRYLDTTLSQIDRRYGRALSKYTQVLEQRNSLLRDLRERPFNASELAVWDQQLVAEGALLVARRAATVEQYNKLTATVHPRLTSGREQLRLVYQPSVLFDGPTPLHQTSLFADAIAAAAPLDPAYVYRLLTGAKCHPSANTVMRLALALSLSVPETDELLMSAGFAPLVFPRSADNDELEPQKPASKN